jgi:hypothetical protein
MRFRYSHRRFLSLAGLLGAIWLGTVIPAQAAQDEESDDSTSSDEDSPEPAAESEKPEPAAESEKPEPAAESEKPEPAAESEKPEPAAESEKPEPAAEPVPPNAAEVALEAQRVHSEYCGSLQGTDRGLAGESFAVIGPIWSRVSGAYRELGDIYLLYWSGLLSECLGRGEDAVSDLEAFLADEKSRPLVSMVADAEWRLRRRLRVSSSQGTSKRRGPRPLAFQLRARGSARSQGAFAAFVPSIGFGAAASVGAVIALSEWSGAGDEIPQQGEDEFGLPRMVLDHSIRAATERVNTARVVGTVSVGLAVSSAVSLIVASVSQAKRRSKVARTAAKVRSSLQVVPGPDGVFLGVTTQW